MTRILKNLAMDAIWVAGVYPTALTKASDLRTLMGTLHPISPGVELRRLGPDGDGGYLVPDDLVGIEACFSPGVSDVSGFEKECADLGMQVFLADKSVEGPAASHDRFRFTKKHVGVTTSDDFMTLDDWVHSSLPGSTSDLLLQIDTEGHEYGTFLSMSSGLMQRCRIIVAEFHRLPLLWSRPFFRFAAPVFEKILQTHACVHIHPNNCRRARVKHDLELPHLMEFTFLRRDRVRNPSFTNVFPHPLDRDNTSKAALTLPACWHRK